jgi:hypothetical protein
MQHISDWNELIDKIHTNAVEHGFWENNPSPEHFLCLVISELMESVEAHRNRKYADVKAYNDGMESSIEVSQRYRHDTDIFRQTRPKVVFEKYIKDTVEDELADAVIRILDLAGGRKVSLSSLYDSCTVLDSLSHISNRNSFTENIYTVVRFITCEMDLSFRLTIALRMIEAITELNDIDLAWHIENKIFYNTYRSYCIGK